MGRLLQLLHKVGRNSTYPDNASPGPPPICQQPCHCLWWCWPPWSVQLRTGCLLVATEVSRATLLGPSAMPPLRGSATRGLSRMPGRSLGRSVFLFPGRSATLSPGRFVSPSPARSVFLSQSRFLARSVTPPQLVSPKGASLAGPMDTFIRLPPWPLSVLWLLWLLLVLLELLERLVPLVDMPFRVDMVSLQPDVDMCCSLSLYPLCSLL